MISILRMLTAPVLILILSSLDSDEKGSIIAAIVFAAAALTDWLDGYLARKMGVETTFGKFLDPLADKLLIVSCLVMLIPLGRAPAWMVALIIGREIAVTGLRGIASAEGVIIAAGRLGKYKTILQIASVTALLAHYKFLGIDFQTLGMVFLWAALIFTIWSGVDYFARFLKKTA
ncbi:MAG: CDP-diacylglycerol--glycerol-3-phosphate 3-phosphatidyltransferase [Deltaproteobacteria bacterium]|nr:CDP-diacylglycerol--glycerol-3-phosphate 3-phosphatidyltransferase [Deltaproteobacteria bacterium]